MHIHCLDVQIAARVGVCSDAVKNVIIWGNHSSTQFPDVSHATVDVEGKTVPVCEAVKDDDWIEGDFITVCYHNLVDQP